MSFFLTEETASFRLLHLADVTIVFSLFCMLQHFIQYCVMSDRRGNVAHEVFTSEFIILVDMKKNCFPSATRRKEARYLW